MSDIAAVLDRAAQLIDEHGWTSGLNTDREGRMCASFAIARAACEQVRAELHSDDWSDPTYQLKHDWLMRRTHRALDAFRSMQADPNVRAAHNTVTWNDGPDQSKIGVVSMLRAAAVDLKTKEEWT